MNTIPPSLLGRFNPEVSAPRAVSEVRLVQPMQAVQRMPQRPEGVFDAAPSTASIIGND